jgi:vacuolar iron transporter family protein
MPLTQQFPLHAAERHRSSRIGWLRASVLGANDGILSTGSLIVGVASAHSTQENILIAGIASLVAGALSMAAGEYVSVSSQSDTENADLELERIELSQNPEHEKSELAAIYRERGLDPQLANEVAEQLTARDALSAHARDELGIFPAIQARPVQAAFASAGSFAVGAALPLILVLLIQSEVLVPAIIGASVALLALLGGLAAKTGGAVVWKGALRVAIWGAMAMGLTAGIGRLSGTIL